MISVETIALLTLVYCALLFLLASWAEKRRESGRSVVANPHVYALSLTVYCTSLTYYGAVGRAATSGLDFLPIYLGPTLIAFTWWFLLRRMVQVAKEQNIVSLADFITSRYDKSALLGSAVTLFSVVGILPYTALQLRAVSTSFDLLTSPYQSGALAGTAMLPVASGIDSAAIAALVLGLFSILFGARHLDAGTRHEGLMAALALEALVKLVCLLTVGLFVTYGLFDGAGDIFSRFQLTFPDRQQLLLLGNDLTSYPKWFTLTFLGMASVLLLPRQFQVAVIENADANHIYPAMWRFPLYLLVSSLFVLPIGLGGLLLSGGSTINADFFVLTLPLETGHTWLALIAFLGGFAASAGMVMVTSVALSTMILNHLIVPVLLRLRWRQKDMSHLLINLKRFTILVTVFLGYLCYRLIGESYALMTLGLLSFAAAAQFAPIVIGGLYWPKANKTGAAVGLCGGFFVWAYTLFLPSLVRAGWLQSDLMETGLFNIQILRPQELFGLSGLDMWTHSLFWSLLINVGAFILFGVFTRQSITEHEQVRKFHAGRAEEEPTSRQRLTRPPTILEFMDLMTKFIGEKKAQLAITEYVGDREIDAQGRLSDLEIPNLKRFTERTLAGYVGAAPARIIIENYLATRGSTMEDVFDIFGSVTLSRESSREQLGVLFEVARQVASGKDLRSTLESILELILQQFKFSLCVVRVHDPASQTLQVFSQRGLASNQLGQLAPAADMETYLGQAFLTGDVTVINDTDFLDKPKSAQIIHREGIKSFIHAPVALDGKPIGVLSAFSRTAKGIFTEEFVELFRNLAGQVAVAWRNDQQTRALLNAREQEKELEIAKTIQLGLLPTKTPDLPGVSLQGTYVAAQQVGGDYYDFIVRPNGVVDLLVADVSGHNIGAALLMAETRTFIRAKAREIDSPSEMLFAVNNFFNKDLSRAELFITMFYLQFNTHTRELIYANAGHNLPLVWRDDRQYCEWLDADGLILGITKNVEFAENRTRLGLGDVLVLYTDGVTEAENPQGEFFGEKGLCRLVKDKHMQSASSINALIIDNALAFTTHSHFRDDVTLVVMKVEETTETAETAS